MTNRSYQNDEHGLTRDLRAILERAVGVMNFDEIEECFHDALSEIASEKDEPLASAIDRTKRSDENL